MSEPNSDHNTPFLPKQYDPEEHERKDTSDILVVEIDDNEMI